MALQLCENGHYFDPRKNPKCPFCADGASPESKPKDAVVSRLPSEPAVADLPVGWLVSIDGATWGTDFRIRPGKNTIGRLPGAGILIPDLTLSPYEHAFLIYDEASNVFSLNPGAGAGQSYVNGRPLESAVALRAGDKLKLGATTLLFVPLAGENFRWSSAP